jgi:hypothetical protein
VLSHQEYNYAHRVQHAAPPKDALRALRAYRRECEALLDRKANTFGAVHMGSTIYAQPRAGSGPSIATCSSCTATYQRVWRGRRYEVTRDMHGRVARAQLFSTRGPVLCAACVCKAEGVLP